MRSINLCTPLHKRTAKPEEESQLRRQITWSRKHGELYAGLPGDMQLSGSDGVHLSLLVTEELGRSRELLTQALREAYRERDVVSHEVVVCPISWFEH